MVHAVQRTMLHENASVISLRREASTSCKRGFVLVVDDSEDACELLRHDLGVAYEVVSVTSGQAALERLRDGPLPVALVVDLLMPHMDGVELVDAVRADPGLASLAVVFVSALYVPLAVRRDDAIYVTKPYRPLELLEALQRPLMRR